ncbi:MAG: PEP-CTERM sorting domain-containing protein, partial [Burkholderiales bacterium]
VVRLSDADEANGTRNIFFFSSDDTITVPIHPLLTVTVPEPSSLLFSLCGGGGLLLAALARQSRRR